MWLRTVTGEMKSLAAMSAVVMPRPRSPRISLSRLVRDATMLFLRRNRPERLGDRPFFVPGAVVHGRAQDVNERRERRVVGRNRECFHVEPLPTVPGADRQRELAHGVGLVAGLESDAAVVEAVDIPEGIAAGHDVVTMFPEHRPRGQAQKLFALLVPEDDALARVPREDRLTSPGKPVDELRSLGLHHPEGYRADAAPPDAITSSVTGELLGAKKGKEALRAPPAVRRRFGPRTGPPERFRVNILHPWMRVVIEAHQSRGGVLERRSASTFFRRPLS